MLLLASNLARRHGWRGGGANLATEEGGWGWARTPVRFWGTGGVPAELGISEFRGGVAETNHLMAPVSSMMNMERSAHLGSGMDVKSRSETGL